MVEEEKRLRWTRDIGSRPLSSLRNVVLSVQRAAQWVLGHGQWQGPSARTLLDLQMCCVLGTAARLSLKSHQTSSPRQVVWGFGTYLMSSPISTPAANAMKHRPQMMIIIIRIRIITISPWSVPPLILIR